MQQGPPPRTIVSVEDAALDRVKMNVRKYGETRDESSIVELPGRRATRYLVRRLERRETQFIRGRGAAEWVANAFIQYGLVQIERPEGVVVKPTAEMPDVNGRAAVQIVWDQPELDQLWNDVGETAFYEIAQVIEQTAGKRLGEASGSSAGRFSLLPSSLSALDQIERQPAA